MARKTAQTFVISAQQFEALQALQSWGRLENIKRDRKRSFGDRFSAGLQIPWARRTVREAGRRISGLGGVKPGAAGGTLHLAGGSRRATPDQRTPAPDRPESIHTDSGAAPVTPGRAPFVDPAVRAAAQAKLQARLSRLKK